jgi:hypothetical protein
LSVARGGTGVTTSTGTGNVVLSTAPLFDGVVSFGGTTIVGLEIGDTTSGAGTATAYIDFHTGANVDYDARIVASGGTGSGGDADIDVECATFDITGDLNVAGTKNFKINHPLPALNATHYLVHAAIESPRVNNKYSGMVTLVNGYASVDIDESFGMTPGTFEALNRNCARTTTNESGFSRVRSRLTGAVLEIFCEDATSSDEVYWEVTGERKDEQILSSGNTDEQGHLIIEPKKLA